MKVFKNLFGRGDKIHVDEIAVAPGLLLGGAVIVESGSNENGEYVRFGDGTQMCWCTMTLPYASIARLAATWTFPKPFKDTDYAISHAFHGTPSTANSLAVGDYGPNMYFQATATSIQVNVYRATGTANFVAGDTCLVKVQAIGRWK